VFSRIGLFGWLNSGDLLLSSKFGLLPKGGLKCAYSFPFCSLLLCFYVLWGFGLKVLSSKVQGVDIILVTQADQDQVQDRAQVLAHRQGFIPATGRQRQGTVLGRISLAEDIGPICRPWASKAQGVLDLKLQQSRHLAYICVYHLGAMVIWPQNPMV
jgi:hypothetical protein